MIDLHMHSNLSDGTDSVDELIDKLIEKNVKYFAITDHDNCKSCALIDKRKKELDQLCIKHTNGIELSIDFEGDSMHILVYNFDDDSKVINGIIDEIFNLRLNRVQARIDVLESEFNIVLNDEEKAWIFSHTNPGKPHIARVLINRGIVSSIDEAIKKYMYHKYSGKKLDAKDVVKLLADNGCFVGIAHPLGGADEKRISPEKFRYNVEVLKDCGIKFLECYYSLYNEQERELIREVAGNYGLLLSGGSDYHGNNKTVKLLDLGKDYVPNPEDLTVVSCIFN